MMKNNIFDLDSYDYELPSSLIASSPANPKESANLLVYQRSNNKITHTKFGNLMEFLPDCDIIFNDTKVIKARIYGKKSSGGAVELLLNQWLQNALLDICHQEKYIQSRLVLY